jgi:hypothetical protein
MRYTCNFAHARIGWREPFADQNPPTLITGDRLSNEMSNKPDLAEKIGTAINELDIDFSQFTVAGWILSLLSLGTGGGAAYWAGSAMVKRNGLNLAAGITFCLTMIAVTTIVFLALRSFFGLAGLTVTKSR